MREFLGFGGYTRPAEGFLSPQHLIFVTLLMIAMVFFAAFFGKKNRLRDDHIRNRALVVAAIGIDALELFKIIIICIRGKDSMGWLFMLPLFLCSIQLITIPLAAFSHGRIREAALDFVLIFGILGAVLGTYGAGNNYSVYPVLSLDNVVSGLTHSISGFASLYIAFSGMTSMKKRNIPITFAILLGFCGAAMIANKLLPYNYMFLVRGDGTPYDILYALVNGHPVLYPMMVILLFLLYIGAFYCVLHLLRRRQGKADRTAAVGAQA